MSRATTVPPRARTGRVRLASADRQRQLAEAAATKFHHLGFHRVSMADLAATVGVTAPAIYRHFPDKQALLAAAVTTALDEVEAAADASGTTPWPETLERLADVAIRRRDLWILLQRELRHLDAERRAPISARFDLLVRRLRTALAAATPDLDRGSLTLRVTATLAVLSSPSVTRTALTPGAYAALLAQAAVAVGRTLVPTATGRGSVGRGSVGRGSAGRARPADANAAPRSEEVLRTSLELFHEHGFDAVSLDDIGARVGMAGPSIYHHFATKADLLVTAFTRAAEGLSVSTGDQPADLDTVVRAYVDLGVRERLLFGVYVLEAVNLPPTVGRRIRASLDRDVAAWSAALAVARPELTAPQRLVLVHAARAVVHDVVRVGRLHDRPRIAEELHALVGAVLAAPVGS